MTKHNWQNQEALVKEEQAKDELIDQLNKELEDLAKIIARVEQATKNLNKTTD
jgi:hypothetical protein